MCPWEDCGDAGRGLGQVVEDGTESLVAGRSDMKMCYGVLSGRRASPKSIF